MNKWLEGLFNLLFPRCCLICGVVLSRNENFLCITCLTGLPRTNYHQETDNEIEKGFWGKFILGRATSYFFYDKDSDYHKIIHELKYHNCPQVGQVMGRCFSKEILSSGFFDDVDLIIPVPLHPKKQKARGYNQSEWIAKGVSEVTGLAIETEIIKRVVDNSSQTRKGVLERWENVDGIFKITNLENIRGKHLLLVDDVLTTGATISSCAASLNKVEGIKISVLTLAVV